MENRPNIELNKIYTGQALDVLRTFPDKSVNCCVTSPPYWGLRDYGVTGQLGMEKTPEEFIRNMVEVFREVKRVLKDDGTIWVNIGDSYSSKAGGYDVTGSRGTTAKISKKTQAAVVKKPRNPVEGLKPKDLVGIPWLLAFALRADGWYLRCDIIWAKKNCMPESVTDRPTKSHEYIFLLSKSQKYFYNHEAIKEPALYDVDGTGTASRKARQRDGLKSNPTNERVGIRASDFSDPHEYFEARLAAGFKDSEKFEGKNGKADKQRGHSRRHNGFNDRWDKMTHEEQCTGMRNKRDVWHISPAQFPEAHFATFPEEIPEICIKAGSKENDVILDPFMGAGTTAVVAAKLGRKYVGIELNPEYVSIAENRLQRELGMFYKAS
jgi:DNA modification methylase